ncbi:MAG: chloride channel protein, partial [Bacteroidales bacterium]|nr:chloride channel protein [Bacteroidales bacterium]
MFRRLLTLFRNMQERNKLLILSLLVGIASGVAAVILLKLIHLIQNLLASALAGSTHALLFLVLPGIGMFISLLLLRFV